MSTRVHDVLLGRGVGVDDRYHIIIVVVYCEYRRIPVPINIPTKERFTNKESAWIDSLALV